MIASNHHIYKHSMRRFIPSTAHCEGHHKRSLERHISRTHAACDANTEPACHAKKNLSTRSQEFTNTSDRFMVSQIKEMKP